MNAALAIKTGLIELGNTIAGVSAQAGPTFGDWRGDKDAIIVTLSSSSPSDAGDEMETLDASQVYGAGRAQTWTSVFDLEFWSRTSEANLNRHTEFADMVRNSSHIGGIRAQSLPDSIGSESNSGEKDDRWVILSADMRILHLATHSGRTP